LAGVGTAATLGGTPLCSAGGRRGADLLELQAELNRWIEEALHGGKRHVQAFRNAAEGHADLEAFVGHYQIPELMLQDDGHLLGILRQHARRQAHAVRAGVEGNIEMMLPGQAVLGGVDEHLVHDPAQGLLGQDIVPDVIDGHGVIRLP
jgi:hypothetical protein